MIQSAAISIGVPLRISSYAKDEGRAYAKKLKENGNEVEHVEYDDTVHAFFSWATIFKSSKKAVDLACESMKKVVG